jgi:16S rRNA (guanine(966)-N(2))-methyltransferase RsmD
MFNAVGARLDFNGLRVLDLFAGSGALGIEALSRGAESCTFVDINAKAICVINENLEKTGLSGKARVVKGDFWTVLKDGAQWDLILLDAPYNMKLTNETVAAIKEYGNLAEGGLIVAEHGAKEEIELAGFAEVKKYKAGSVGITLLGVEK